jgi:tetratricopeptide (TPR) repeat protein
MLNAKCWYQATWNYRAEELDQLCTEAVEKADWSAPVLDSRAMGYYRLGRFEDALKDLESALSTSPELARRCSCAASCGASSATAPARTTSARRSRASRRSRREYARFGIKAD